MKITTVLFLFETDTKLKNHFKKHFSVNKEIKLIFPKNFSQKNLIKLSENTDIIIGWRPSKEILNAAKKLKLFINPGTGIKHHIENFRELNKQRKVVLVNGHGHSYATAQHAVAMLLALMNRIIPHHNRMKDGIWQTSDNEDFLSATLSLRKRKIGLLGYGAINKNVHKFLSGFENEFHLLKRDLEFGNLDLGFNKNKIYKYSTKELHKFLKAIDVLIIAIPHTSKTEKLIGKKELKLLGKNGLLINIARGTIVDEESLYEALKKNIIAGAALDVWYNYNPKKDNKGKSYPFKFPFHKLNNVLMSPHRAASPFDDLSRWDEVFENIRRVSSGRTDYLNIVDLKKEY